MSCFVQSDLSNGVDTTAHVIEILTEKASNSYKAFLRKLNISYIIAGKDELDYSLAMEKLYDLFDIHTLMLGGGGILNWSFIQTDIYRNYPHCICSNEGPCAGTFHLSVCQNDGTEKLRFYLLDSGIPQVQKCCVKGIRLQPTYQCRRI